MRSRSTSSAAKSGRLSMSQMMSASWCIAIAGPSAKYATSSVSVYALVLAPRRSISREMILVVGTALGALEEHVLEVVREAGGLRSLVARARAHDQEHAGVAAGSTAR